MSRTRTAGWALLSGVVFALAIRMVDQSSSGLHVGRVVLAGALFAVAMYAFQRRREMRRR